MRRLGLALGGGGAKGSAHIGVLREFERLGLEFDMISGTSIGAIVGAVLAAGYPSSAIEEAFRGTSLWQLLAFDPARLGLIGSDRLRTILHDLLGDRHIEELPTPFAAVAVDLVTGQELMLDHGLVVEAVLASAAIPGVFPPRRAGKRVLVDGGVSNNLPVSVARQLGAERVIAVNLMAVYDQFAVDDPQHASLLSLRRWAPIIQLELGVRAIELMIGHLTNQRLRDDPPDLLLAPDVNGITMASLMQLEPGIQAGVAAVRPYAAELDALRRWRLGQDASLMVES